MYKGGVDKRILAQNAFSTNRVVVEIETNQYVKDKITLSAMYMKFQRPPEMTGPILTKEEKIELGITSRRKIHKQELDLFTIEGVRNNTNAYLNSRYGFWQTFCLAENNKHQLESAEVKKIEFGFYRKCPSCPRADTFKPGLYALKDAPEIPCRDCDKCDFCTAFFSPKFD